MQDSNLGSQLLLTSYLLYIESPLDYKEIKPVNSKGNQLWVFTGRTDAKAEASILWPTWYEKKTHWKKTLMLGKTEDQRRRGWRDEMVGWHQWTWLNELNEHESEQTPGASEGQGRLTWSSPWGHKSQTCLSNWTTTTLHWLSLIF